jgi:hypothetical protein
MTTSVFVSHVYEDRNWIAQLRDWNAKGQLGPNLTFTTETDDTRQNGETAIKNHVRPFILGASVVLVLIGDDAHNHDWVRYEIDVALSNRKRLVLARIPGTTGAPPLHTSGMTIVKWTPESLRIALAS